MEQTQVGAKRLPPCREAIHIHNSLQEVIKREGENESSDDTSYRPRTQLGHPIILQRTLAWLMSKYDKHADKRLSFYVQIVNCTLKMGWTMDSLMSIRIINERLSGQASATYK
jgi:hypothetical protein